MTFIFTVSGCNIITARKCDVLKKNKHWTLVWSFGWVKPLFSYVKNLTPNFTHLNLTPLLFLLISKHFLPFTKHIILNAPEMEWCLILSKLLKAQYSVKVLVNFTFMLLVIFMLPNLFKKMFYYYYHYYFSCHKRNYIIGAWKRNRRENWNCNL